MRRDGVPFKVLIDSNKRDQSATGKYASSLAAGVFQRTPPLNWHRVTLQRIDAFLVARQMCSLRVEWGTNHADCQGKGKRKGGREI